MRLTIAQDAAGINAETLNKTARSAANDDVGAFAGAHSL